MSAWCKGNKKKRKRSRNGGMHAQADRNHQHHDRSPGRSGIPVAYAGVTAEIALKRSVLERAREARRTVRGRVKAVSRRRRGAQHQP